LVQVVAVVTTVAYSLVATWIILKVVDRLVGLRVGMKEEEVGLDIGLHLEEAYTY
jgi:Amt family ammonium transporter